LILVAIILLVRSPWGQGIIVNKATSFIEKETGTKLSIDRLFITFSGNIYLEGVYLEDLSGDTLLFSNKLEAGLEFLPLLSSGDIKISKLHWDGVKGNVSRKAKTEDFNFTFLIEAFLPQSAEEPEAPDSTSSALKLALKDISLSNFNLNYQDEFLGISSKLILGELRMDLPQIDLETMAIEISEISLRNTKADYLQTKPFPETPPDTTASSPINLILKNLAIQNVQLNYKNKVDQQLAEIDLKELLLKLPKVDLKNQEVKLELFELKNSSILFHDFSIPSANSAAESDSSSVPFTWPEWIVSAKQITLGNNQIEFKTSEIDFRKGFFNPEAIRITNLTADLSDLILENKSASAQVNSLQFEEASGFLLKGFSVSLASNDLETSIENLNLAINQSQLTGDLKLTYNSITELIQHPELIGFDLNLKAPTLSVQDAYYFQPTLAQDTLIQKLEAYPFSAELVVDGTLDLLQISFADLNWGKTNFFASGQVSDVLDLDLLRFDFPEVQLKASRETLIAFVSESELGIQLPENFLLTGQASGQLDNLGLEFDFKSTLGDLALVASYQDQDQLAFDVNLEAKALQLNNLLQNQELDTVYFSLNANGSGRNWYEINAEIQAKFDSLQLYQNDYSGLAISGKLENGSGTLSSDLDSKNLRYDLTATVDLDSINSKINLNLNLIGADLTALGLTQKSTKAQLNLEANFEGNFEEFQANATISNATVVQEQRPYPLGTIRLTAFVKNDSTSIDLESRPMVGFLQANANPSELSAALTKYFNGYFGIKDTLASKGDVVLNMNFALQQDPILNEILLPGLIQLDSSSIKVNFFEAEKTLSANVNFGGAEIDSLGIQINSDSSRFDFKFGFSALNTGPIDMDKTLISGNLDNARLLLDLQFFEKSEILTQISSQIDLLSDSVKIKVLPENLILDKKVWTVPSSNSLTYSNQEITFTDMLFTADNQKVELTDELESLEKPHIAAVFDGFRLENLTSFLNPVDVIADGLVQGRLIVQKPFGALGILGDLKIDSLAVLSTNLGTLNLNAVAKSIGNYGLKADLGGGGIDLKINGNFIADEEAASFDLELDLTRLELAILEDLIPGQITQASGILQGKINANGTTTDPNYTGLLTFKGASITPTLVGTKYLFEDESIRLDNAGIYFDNFTVRDEAQNTFALGGEIGTESFINPTFDLQVTAKKFMAINSTDKESELFFGTGTIDADVSITGNLLLPVVRGTIAVKDQTDLTFIVPESQAELVERNGVVVFVNKKNPDSILTRNDEEISNSFNGYDIKLLLEVDPTARFKIVIDSNSGDNLALTASGELDLAVDPIGRTSLSGRLVVQSGHYEMSLYSLVNRRFEIVPGSTIVWNGDPLDATLDISASYEVRTAAAPLMASQLTGSGDATQSQYSKRLDFFVYLYLDGDLLKPVITFGLDMPEDERGEFGGNVYSQVRQLGEQEAELNRQVFSLLVLNRFFPSGGSDGSSGGTEALARNSVSQLLSDQLNNFSNQLFGDSGFEVGFEVDSYTNGQAGKSQTELNVSAQQTLFNDRLTVQVGSQFDVEGNSQTSQDAGAILGNVSIEYTLTEDGRFKIRAFRKNQFESIIDGQLIVTGLGVVFNREFNNFGQLWEKPIDPEVEIKSNPIDELDNKSGKKKAKKRTENNNDLRKDEY
jgi:translocation and assembly module TamB